MQIRERQVEEEPPVNLMPLIDMVFLLLIFFLVASTISAEERDIELKLPVMTEPTTLSDPPKQLIINIRENGDAVVNGEVLPEDRLRATVAEYAASNPDPKVLIRADQSSLHLYFAGVVNLVQAAGTRELEIGYLPPEVAVEGGS